MIVCGARCTVHGEVTLFAAWELNGETGAGPDAEMTDLLAGDGAAWAGSPSPAPGSRDHLRFSVTGSGFDTRVNGSPLKGKEPKTLVAWVNAVRLTTTFYPVSYSPSKGRDNGAGLRLTIDRDGNIGGEINNGYFRYEVPDSSRNGPGLIGDGWTMIAAVFLGETRESWLYIGGKGKVSPGVVRSRWLRTGSDAGPAGMIHLGKTHFGEPESLPLEVGIDMVAIYKGAATEEELDRIYADGISVLGGTTEPSRIDVPPAKSTPDPVDSGNVKTWPLSENMIIAVPFAFNGPINLNGNELTLQNGAQISLGDHCLYARKGSRSNLRLDGGVLQAGCIRDLDLLLAGDTQVELSSEHSPLERVRIHLLPEAQCSIFFKNKNVEWVRSILSSVTTAKGTAAQYGVDVQIRAVGSGAIARFNPEGP